MAIVIPGWAVVAAKIANSPAGQWVRRRLAKRSAEEMKRREREKQIEKLAKTLTTLLAVSVISGGCAHMPDWALRAHVSGYNKLHPDTPVEVEE